MLIGVIGFVYQPNVNTAEIISGVLILLVLILLIYRVETALCNTFKTE